jgi:NADPH:quinone reductase-like Zn-dependent oxidoreductase
MKSAELSRRMALASHELRAQLPPATLLPAIHRGLARGRWKPRSAGQRWLSWAGWAGLGTASVALAAALVVNSIVDVDTPAQVASDDGFVTLVNNDEWQRARTDGSRTWLVTTELPHSRLAALGLPYDPARAGERVPAQLLMQASGEVLAVRLDR